MYGAKSAPSFIPRSLSALQSDFVSVRNDYKELINLCIKFLGGKISFDFRTPGALHKACWMTKLLQNFKLCLLQSAIEELPPRHN